MKQAIGLLLIIFTIIGIGTWIYIGVKANWEYENNISSNWSLSDKASTLSAKADYIDKFIVGLRNGNLADNDALWWKTADNNCENNVKAVETLKNRLSEIKGMDESSFAYQTAIQQITQQEQGEASKLTDTLAGCWYKTNYYFLWNPLLNLLSFALIIAGLWVGVYLLDNHY